MKTPVTLLLILVASALFALGVYTAPSLEGQPVLWTQSAASLPPVDRALLFDFPLRDQLIEQWAETKNPALLSQIAVTPVWPGLYDVITKQAPTGPLFESIRQGQVWRLFTPAVLHGNLMHLFFNILWLFFLGTLVEQRLGFMRFLALILFVALFSNICQYMMSGANFLGLSGIITGLVGYIWVRKRHDYWPVPKVTILMIAVFVSGSALLQTLFFLVGSELTTGLANTAHITGALAGALAGVYERS